MYLHFYLQGRHAANLMSHLKHHHKEVHKQVELQWKKMQEGPASSKSKCELKAKVLNGVQMTGPALFLHSLRLITENGLSFKVLDYEAFQDIIKPMINAMPASEK